MKQWTDSVTTAGFEYPVTLEIDCPFCALSRVFIQEDGPGCRAKIYYLIIPHH